MNILITGGASGLGEAITQRLAANKDDTVFFTYHKSLEKANKLASAYPNVTGIHCDFHDQSKVDNLLTFINSISLDILINNAFTSNITPKHFHKTDISIFNDNFHANIIPTVLITKQVILNFRKKKFGKIINILSSAIVGNPPVGWSEYTAEKAYLSSLSKSWAIENSAYNITSNSISPSFMQTGFTVNTDDRVIEGIKGNHPYKELLTISEVSDAVFFLSKCSQQINGVNLIMNAGAHVI